MDSFWREQPMRTRLYGATLALCVAAMPAVAQASPPGKYQLIGSGTISCGTWTAQRRQGQAWPAQQWILGFLSGVSYESSSGDNPLSGVDADAVWAWMDNYCQTNPLDHIFLAGEIFAALHPR